MSALTFVFIILLAYLWKFRESSDSKTN